MRIKTSTIPWVLFLLLSCSKEEETLFENFLVAKVNGKDYKTECEAEYSLATANSSQQVTKIMAREPHSGTDSRVIEIHFQREVTEGEDLSYPPVDSTLPGVHFVYFGAVGGKPVAFYETREGCPGSLGMVAITSYDRENGITGDFSFTACAKDSSYVEVTEGEFSCPLKLKK